jgi:hypothetical protein
MTPVESTMFEFASSLIKDARPVESPGLPSRVRRFADAEDNHYVVKHHHDATRFSRELQAYRVDLDPIRDLTPELVGVDHDHLNLLLTWVPGTSGSDLETGSEAEINLHRDAGRGLSRLHQSSCESASRTIGPALADRLQLWRARVSKDLVLTAAERGSIDSACRYLAATPMATSICHLDFQPRNWRRDLDGAFRLLDFEHLRRDARIRDLARSWWRHWHDRPQLKEAFLEGYGIHLDNTDRRLLDAFGFYEALTALGRGQEAEEPELYDFGRNLLDALT